MNFLKRLINLVPITILVTVLIFPFIAFSQGQGPDAIKISPQTLDKTKFNKGDSFNQTFSYTGTFPNQSKPQWEVQPIPPGLTEAVDSDTGNLIVSGTLTTIGTFSLHVVLSDGKGTAGSKTYSISVAAASSEPVPPTTTPTDNPTDPKGNNAGPGTKPPANNPSGGGSSNNSGEFYNPLGGVNTIPALIVKATKIILALTGMLAVLFIIIGGLRYITSGGSPEAVKSAKNTVTYAIIGLVIAVMAFAIVNVVTNLLINK